MKTLLTCCLFFLWSASIAQVQVPEAIIGNWVNEKSNNWEYGFYEQFAIYDSDFWEYESISTRKNRVEIKLRKGNQREALTLKLPKKTGSTIAIARQDEKAAKYKLNRPGFFPYTTADHKPFKNSGYQPDSVTIIGFYRHMTEYQKQSGSARALAPFRVSAQNFILGKPVDYYADIDSLGRFKVKFPVLNTQEVHLDWGRLMQVDVVEPGETIFLFADMLDYTGIANIRSMEDMMAFYNKPKSTIYMGKEARLHNELAQYKSSAAHINRDEQRSKGTSDLEYLAAHDANFQERKRHLENYIKSNPTVSNRFKEYQFAQEKYSLAFYLMQYRFDKLKKKEVAFDKGYLDFVEALVLFDDEKLFTLVRDYSVFIRDYVDYCKSLKTYYKDEKTGELRFGGVSVNHNDVYVILKNNGFFNEQDTKVLSDFEALQTTLKAQANKDSARTAAFIKPYSALIKSYNDLLSRPDVQEAVKELVSEQLAKKAMEAEIQHLDTLFQNKVLKELLLATMFYSSIENRRVPLPQEALAAINEQITSQHIKDYVLDVNNYYINLGNKKVSYLNSLKNTDHLKEAKDAETLFSHLIAPYKGKVIYLDFWGTWCGPCRQQMPFATAVKKELAGKDVVFMYLANGSPEKSWQNVIKEYDLTGENVVHFNLPQKQQDMIERKFSVNSFPTYMLIGKDGNVITLEAPRPEQKNDLIGAIDKLLAE